MKWPMYGRHKRGQSLDAHPSFNPLDAASGNSGSVGGGPAAAQPNVVSGPIGFAAMPQNTAYPGMSGSPMYGQPSPQHQGWPPPPYAHHFPAAAQYDPARAQEEHQMAVALAASAQDFQRQQAQALGFGGLQLAQAQQQSQQEARRKLQMDAARKASKEVREPGVALAFKYWSTGCLDYTDVIPVQGFYEVYGDYPEIEDLVDASKFPTLEALQRVQTLDGDPREVVLIEVEQDSWLTAVFIRAEDATSKANSQGAAARVKGLASVVVESLGGAYDQDDTLSHFWLAASSREKKLRRSVVIPLGRLGVGSARHRALLFKLLADTLNIKCQIRKGVSASGTDDLAVAFVQMAGKEYIVDLVTNPGALLAASGFTTQHDRFKRSKSSRRTTRKPAVPAGPIPVLPPPPPPAVLTTVSQRGSLKLAGVESAASDSGTPHHASSGATDHAHSAGSSSTGLSHATTPHGMAGNGALVPLPSMSVLPVAPVGSGPEGHRGHAVSFDDLASQRGSQAGGVAGTDNTVSSRAPSPFDALARDKSISQHGMPNKSFSATDLPTTKSKCMGVTLGDLIRLDSEDGGGPRKQAQAEQGAAGLQAASSDSDEAGGAWVTFNSLTQGSALVAAIQEAREYILSGAASSLSPATTPNLQVSTKSSERLAPHTSSLLPIQGSAISQSNLNSSCVNSPFATTAAMAHVSPAPGDTAFAGSGSATQGREHSKGSAYVSAETQGASLHAHLGPAHSSPSSPQKLPQPSPSSPSYHAQQQPQPQVYTTGISSLWAILTPPPGLISAFQTSSPQAYNAPLGIQPQPGQPGMVIGEQYQGQQGPGHMNQQQGHQRQSISAQSSGNSVVGSASNFAGAAPGLQSTWQGQGQAGAGQWQHTGPPPIAGRAPGLQPIQQGQGQALVAPIGSRQSAALSAWQPSGQQQQQSTITGSASPTGPQQQMGIRSGGSAIMQPVASSSQSASSMGVQLSSKAQTQGQQFFAELSPFCGNANLQGTGSLPAVQSLYPRPSSSTTAGHGSGAMAGSSPVSQLDVIADIEEATGQLASAHIQHRPTNSLDEESNRSSASSNNGLLRNMSVVPVSGNNIQGVVLSGRTSQVPASTPTAWQTWGADGVQALYKASTAGAVYRGPTLQALPPPQQQAMQYQSTPGGGLPSPWAGQGKSKASTFSSPAAGTLVRIPSGTAPGWVSANGVLAGSQADDGVLPSVQGKQQGQDKASTAGGSTSPGQQLAMARPVPLLTQMPSLQMNGQWEIDPNELDTSESIRLGMGSYGEVYTAKWRGTVVAVKRFLEQNLSPSVLRDFKAEVSIMSRLRHPNVVLFMGAVAQPSQLAIVTELVTHGSLFKFLQKRRADIPPQRRHKMALGIAKGMNYLHSCKPMVVHRDLKSANLLVEADWTVKVCDFGLSQIKSAAFLTSKTEIGTAEWMAPEILRNEKSDESCDVFSYGVILWELVTGERPWSGMQNQMQVVGAVGWQNKRLDIPSDIQPEVAQLISDCFERDPSARPSFTDILRRLGSLKVLTPSPSLMLAGQQQ